MIMKKHIFLLILFSLFFFGTCEDDDPGTTGGPGSDPPTADFRKVTDIIIADKTNAKFESTSYGDIDSYFWEFEGGLGHSSQEDASYVFEYEGAREVNLTVSGPGGSDDRTLYIVVYPFDPDCNNVNSGSTHLTTRINDLRENNLVKNGYIKIKNNYNVTLDFLLYSPTNWLNGRYTPSYTYSISPGGGGILHVSGSPFVYSNEWGIRVQGTSGVISCIRTVGAVSHFNGSEYYIEATDIYDGT
jgi:PKD repeat protein